jgi:hypothetical protein
MSGQPGEIFNIKIVKRQQPTKYALMMLNAYFTGICFTQSKIIWTFRGSKLKLQVAKYTKFKISNYDLMKRRLAAR